MFRDIIRDTALTNLPEADEVFTNIYVGSYCDDKSFLATSRALLPPRMKPEDEFNSRVYSIRGSGDSLVQYLRECEAFRASNGLFIMSCHSQDESDRENWDTIADNLQKRLPEGWEIEKKIGDFFRKGMKVSCIINREKRVSVVIINDITIQKFHYLQCSFPVLVPWFFDGDNKKLSDNEKALVKSFIERSSSSFLSAIKEIAKQYDFRTMHIKSELSGFERDVSARAIERLKARIESAEREISSYRREISNRLRDIRTDNIKIIGIDESSKKNQGGESEIMEYFISNRNLTLNYATEDCLSFFVSGPVSYFDEDMAERAIENPDSYIYGQQNMDCDWAKTFMTAVFVQQKARIHFCARYDLSIRDIAVSVIQDVPENISENCMINPHLSHYNCLGSYKDEIQDAIMKCDYIYATEQCIASCFSLNFGDYPVMSAFMNDLYRKRDSKFVEYNSEMVSPNELVSIIRKEQDDEQKD